MRWVLVVFLLATPGGGTPVLPLEIPQATELSCGRAAEKLKRDVQSQAPQIVVITSCVDKGSAY
jgi:hypothetical protein